ncbi:hypothetical protein [uncultured Methanoregula sp.]|uniref:hypothetical protein n=1 Tax=uncultured Methanoregula sp. TaxID=1005933 RepID=UPI002AABC946|nr:hypothetical protein [uncultured Methanoregula sp.]
MKKLIKLVIPAIVFLAVCIPLVSAWNVDSYTIDPSGPLAPDTLVNVSFNVGFPTNSSQTTFPVRSDLVMTTDLINPTWSYRIMTSDGGSAVTPGFTNQTLDLGGFLLSNKGRVSQVMSVRLTGTTPGVSTTSPATILNIYEVGGTGSIITSSQVIQTAVVSGPDQISPPASKMNPQSGILDQIIGMFKSLFGM